MSTVDRVVSLVVIALLGAGTFLFARDLFAPTPIIDHADAALRERGIAAIAKEHARQMKIASDLLHARAPAIAKQAAIVHEIAPAAKPVLIAHTEVAQVVTGTSPCLLAPGDKLALTLDLEEWRTPSTAALIGEAIVSGPTGELLRQPINASNTRLHSAAQPMPKPAPSWGVGAVASLDYQLTQRVGAIVVSPGACAGPVCVRGIASGQARIGTWDQLSITLGGFAELR